MTAPIARLSELILGAHRALRATYAGELSIAQLSILRALYQEDEVSQAQLVEATNIDKSTVSAAVAALVAKHYAHSDINTRDDRKNVVSITPMGQIARTTAERALVAAEDELLKRLAPQGRAAALRALKSLVAPK